MNILAKNGRKVAQGTALAVMALTALAPVAANADDWRRTGPSGPSWNSQHNRQDYRDSGRNYRDNGNDNGYRSRDNQNRWDNQNCWDNRNGSDYRNGSDNQNRWDYRNNSGDQDSRWQDRRSQDDKQQTDKNNMRNLAIGAGAVAVYGLLNHNNLATILGAAGAAVAGSQYEKDRHQQSQDNNNWRFHRRY